jgi:hypothetical protein
MSNKPITGKIAGVLNERELTINVGVDQGVCVGMKFKVLANSPVEVKDPDTDAILGTVDREKVRVKASEVFDNYSICKTFRKTIIGEAGFDLSSLGALVRSYQPRRAILETLKAEDSTLPPPISEEESYVKKGDRAIQLINDEE